MWVMKMKITDAERTITSVLGVYKGRILPSSSVCTARHSDCFVYVLSGRADYVFDGKVYTADTDSIIYLSHNSHYSISVTADNYTFIYIDFIFDNEKDTVFSNDIYKSKSLSLLKGHFEKLYRLWQVGNFSDKLYCRSVLYNIYSNIAQTVFAQYISHDRREQMEHIAAYIAENLDDSELTVEKLSCMCNLSAVHFRRLFSYIYHTSPVQFITLARINKARELLTSEEGSVSSIAEKCGYKNHYYFSKVFKIQAGMSPSRFRSFYKTNL